MVAKNIDYSGQYYYKLKSIKVIIKTRSVLFFEQLIYQIKNNIKADEFRNLKFGQTDKYVCVLQVIKRVFKREYYEASTDVPKRNEIKTILNSSRKCLFVIFNCPKRVLLKLVNTFRYLRKFKKI